MFSNWLSTNTSRKQILNALRTRAVFEIYMAKQYEICISQLPSTTSSTVHDGMFILLMNILIMQSRKRILLILPTINHNYDVTEYYVIIIVISLFLIRSEYMETCFLVYRD